MLLNSVFLDGSMAKASNRRAISESHQNQNVVLFVNVFVEIRFVVLIKFEYQTGFKILLSYALSHLFQ